MLAAKRRMCQRHFRKHWHIDLRAWNMISSWILNRLIPETGSKIVIMVYQWSSFFLSNLNVLSLTKSSMHQKPSTEFKRFRIFVKATYSSKLESGSITPKEVWTKILTLRKQEFPNVCLLGEIVLLFLVQTQVSNVLLVYWI